MENNQGQKKNKLEKIIESFKDQAKSLQDIIEKTDKDAIIPALPEVEGESQNPENSEPAK